MSWFSSWIGRLFGKSTPTQSPPKRHRSATSTPAGATYSASKPSVSQLLQKWPLRPESPQAFTAPTLSPEVLSHLRQHIHQIPPMPETWQKMQSVLQQEDVSASDLGEVIARDPVLMARILKTSNSSAYAGSNSPEISNIALAIARLGIDETVNITFQTLAPKLNAKGEKHTQMRHIWMHCQGISALMRLLSEGSPLVTRHDASLIGMLHDIGKLVILHIEPWERIEKLQELIEACSNPLEAESRVLGYTHIDAGMMLALHWQLPKQVQHYINFHHHPELLGTQNVTEHLQHHMLMLQLSHLLFQHFMDQASPVSSVWQAGRRHVREDFRQQLRREINLPMESNVLYSQLAEQASRIEVQFPDLFEKKEEA